MRLRRLPLLLRPIWPVSAAFRRKGVGRKRDLQPNVVVVTFEALVASRGRSRW